MKRLLVLSAFLLAACAPSSDAPAMSPEPLILAQGEATPYVWPEEYRVAFNLRVPQGWTFNCCIDMDNASWHDLLQGSPEQESSYTAPRIRMLEHGMVMCPEAGECNIVTTEPVTPEEFARRHLARLDDNDFSWSGLERTFEGRLEKKGPVTLPNFPVSATLYSGLATSGEPVDLYVVASKEGVFDMLVYQPVQFSERFLTAFFEGLSPRAR